MLLINYFKEVYFIEHLFYAYLSSHVNAIQASWKLDVLLGYYFSLCMFDKRVGVKRVEGVVKVSYCLLSNKLYIIFLNSVFHYHRLPWVEGNFKMISLSNRHIEHFEAIEAQPLHPVTHTSLITHIRK